MLECRILAGRVAVFAVALLASMFVCHLGCAQQETPTQSGETSLLQEEPFDILVLTAEHGGARLEIYPTEFPGRKYKVGKAGTRLRVRLLSLPQREFEVRWPDVATVVVFEDLLLKAATNAYKKGQFDHAYRLLERLANRQPTWPGLDKALRGLMRADAADAFCAGKTVQAMGTLDALFRASPDTPSTTSALFAVANRLFADRLRRKRYVQAREMIGQFENRYGPVRVREHVTKWRKRLEELGNQHIAKARQLTSDPSQALEQVAFARKLWPASKAAAELSRTLLGRHPRVIVGVSRAAAIPSYWNEWSASRAERLLTRRMNEIVSVDSDGARYVPLFGAIHSGEGGMLLTWNMSSVPDRTRAAGLSRFDIADRVMASMDSSQADYLSVWHRSVESIDVSKVGELSIRMKTPLLRSQAFLSLAVEPQRRTGEDPPNEGPNSNGNLEGAGSHTLVPYSVDTLGSYRLNPRYALAQPGQPVEIIEVAYEDGTTLASALRSGDIHVADRLTPLDVESLQGVPDVMTRRYLLPSIHFLLPNTASGTGTRLVNNRTFRRALAFAINRAAILEQDLLGGRNVPGCRLISGPFPPGRGADDPMAYAYDVSILPRKYDPSLGVTLARLGEKEHRGKNGRTEPQLPPHRRPLVLAHPNDHLCRSACEAIAGYLNVAKIECQTLELPPGQSMPDATTEWDLLYVDTVMSEPLVDVHRLFGANGLMTQTSPYLQSALHRMAGTTNWSGARDILKEMHRITHDELTVIPLWQWVDHYAYRSFVSGIGRQTVRLYQDVEKWRVDPAKAF